jgi:hypothetical protein
VIYLLVYFGSEVCNLISFVLFYLCGYCGFFFNFVFNCNYERLKADFFLFLPICYYTLLGDEL